MKYLPLTLPLLLALAACETSQRLGPDPGKDREPPVTTAPHTPQTPPPTASHDESPPADPTVITFSGGIRTDGLDIGTIRVSERSDSVRLVFDSYRWNYPKKTLGEQVDFVGAYTVSYSPEQSLITATVSGYRGFSAPFPDFGRDSLVDSIYHLVYEDDSGYRFQIKLRSAAQVAVFSLNDPGRLVIDITPAHPQ